MLHFDSSQFSAARPLAFDPQARCTKSTRDNEECRACGAEAETIGHILSSCPFHSWHLIKERHDRVLFLLVKAALKARGLVVPSVYKAPGGTARPGVYGTEDITIKVDQVSPTGRRVLPGRTWWYGTGKGRSW